MAAVADEDTAVKDAAKEKEPVNKEKNQKFEKGGDNDISSGPLKARGCTDIPCLIFYIIHWGGYFFVTFLGLADGNPWKLVSPRDYRGDYCGVETQWNNPDQVLLGGHTMLTYTMNVSSTVEVIAKELICSSLAEDSLETIWADQLDKLADYRCACCKSACRSCQGALQMTDIKNPAGIAGQIGGKMGELTNPGEASSLFSANGANGDMFANMWEQATKYFTATCSNSCDSVMGNTTRKFKYTPAPDVSWKAAWDALATNPSVPQAMRDSLSSDFTFAALSLADCPYSERYCVPFPGLVFLELPNMHCLPQISSGLASTVGDAAGTAMQGSTAAAENAAKGLGEAVGTILETIDVFIVVCVLAFIVGLIFLVLLRFFVGCLVWFSLLLVFMFLLGGAAMAYVRSGQCAGETMSSTATAGAVSAAALAQTTVLNTMNGTAAMSEAMTGYGEDYRGAQTRTKTGRLCQNWDEQLPQSHATTPALYPNSDLQENYCRNPEEAPTIWCFTTDLDIRWELCQPIGVLLGECPNGYTVDTETMRDALKIFSYVLLGMAGVWLLLVVCLRNRIRLAIAVNQVAADFIVQTPTVIFVPLIQITVATIWCMLWAFSVTFLLSQVPDGYTPKEAYATYAEAYGTETVPGKCTDKWPTGLVWKDEETCLPGTGNQTGSVLCWKCAPPRYVLDWRFWASFFSYLWNNALLIALGQCIIAGAVGAWFFTKTKDREAGRQGAVVRKSAWIAVRYHLGSLAFGAFILAVVQFIRYVMKYFEKQATAQKNRFAACVAKIVQKILWCLEKCVEFLNKNAYIQIALLGKNFCSSAKAAFYLIIRNFLRFGTVALLGGVIHFIGFMFISIATIAMGYFILLAMHPEVAPVVPMILYMGVGYIAAKLYMNVFQLSVDTALQCFIIVEEMGDEADLDFVPGPLKSLVNNDKKGSWISNPFG